MEARTLEQSVERTLHLDYWLHLPDGYDDATTTWPLILFLHGAGERGDNLDRVKAHGLPKVIEERTDIPALMVAPQCPQGSAWWIQLDALDALLESVVSHYRVDRDRIYLTGLSMGGCGSWHLAAAFPKRFAAVVPICGWGEWYAGFPDHVKVLKDVPIWAFHGAQDDVVPLEGSARLVDVLKSAGSDVQFTVYPDADHDSWTATYDDPALYRWMFAQQR